VPGVSENTRLRLGHAGEELAADHLVRQGFRILDRNYRTLWGELDLVAFDGRALVFCEVKSRTTPPRYGTPFDAVHSAKRGQVRKMARAWLADRPHHPFASTIRFDAIGVLFDRSERLLALEHLEGAF